MIELAPPLQQKEFKNLEAEQCLLGALLLNNSSLEYVSDFLRAHHTMGNSSVTFGQFFSFKAI